MRRRKTSAAHEQWVVRLEHRRVPPCTAVYRRVSPCIAGGARARVKAHAPWSGCLSRIGILPASRARSSTLPPSRRPPSSFRGAYHTFPVYLCLHSSSSSSMSTSSAPPS